MIKYVFLTAAIFVGGWLAWPSGETSSDGHASVLAKPAALATSNSPSQVARPCTTPFSAACLAQASPQSGQSRRIDARRKEMRALGLAIPDIYDEMGLGQLEELSRKHDVYAMLQLALRYRLEVEYLRREPEYDIKESPKEAEQRHWLDAVTNGHARSAMIVADLAWKDGKPAEAVSWSLLAQRMGDPGAEKWLKEKQAMVSPGDQTLAEDRAVGLFHYVLRQQHARLTPQ